MIRTARDHFGKEEQAAFPLAEELLSDAELNDLGARWAQRRGVHLAAAGGAGRAGDPVPRRA